MNEEENLQKKFSYAYTEEKEQELAVNVVEASKGHIAKMWTLRMLVIAVFTVLCCEKVYYDFTYGTALKESTSLIILMYIICGVLWTIVLPMILWKIKVIVIMKEISNMKLNYEGNVDFEIGEDGFSVKCNNEEVEVNWDKIISVKKSKKVVLFIVKEYGELAVPVDMFKSEEECNQIVDLINEKVNLELNEQKEEN